MLKILKPSISKFVFFIKVSNIIFLTVKGVNSDFVLL